MAWTPRLRIESVDRSSILVEQSWRISKYQSSGINRFTFTLNDPSNNITVTHGDDVTIDAGAGTETRFGGIITSTRQIPWGLGRQIECTASDYKLLLERAVLRKSYSSTNDSAIISDAFTTSGITEINTSTHVQTGKQISNITFNGHTLREVMDTIAEITGFMWDVDGDKNLVYKPRIAHTPDVPLLGFSDVPDPATAPFIYAPMHDMAYERILGEFNAVEIRGGILLSADITDTYSGDGSRTIFTTGEQNATSPLDRAPTTSSRIEVQRNTGTDGAPVWTAQTVGIDGYDTLSGSIPVLWTPLTRRLQWNTAPPNFTNSFRVIGRYMRPMQVIVRDEDAIARHTREFRKTVFMDEIESENEARDVAVGLLRRYSDKDVATFKFETDGVNVGDVVRVNSTRHGLVFKPFLVNELQIIPIGGTQYDYQLTASDYQGAMAVAPPSPASSWRNVWRGRGLYNEKFGAETIIRQIRQVQSQKIGFGRSRGTLPRFSIFAFPSAGTTHRDGAAWVSDASSEVFYGVNWIATIVLIGSSTVYVNRIAVRMFRQGNGAAPGTITLSVRDAVEVAPLGTGHYNPTGSDLASATTDGNTLPVQPAASEERLFTMSLTMFAGKRYALIARAPAAVILQGILWPTVSGADPTIRRSGDSGSTWAFDDNGHLNTSIQGDIPITT